MDLWGKKKKQREENINNVFSLNYLFGHTMHKNTCPRSHEIYHFDKPFHALIITVNYMQFVLSMPRKRNFFDEMIHFAKR